MRGLYNSFNDVVSNDGLGSCRDGWSLSSLAGVSLLPTLVNVILQEHGACEETKVNTSVRRIDESYRLVWSVTASHRSLILGVSTERTLAGDSTEFMETVITTMYCGGFYCTHLF